MVAIVPPAGWEGSASPAAETAVFTQLRNPVEPALTASTTASINFPPDFAVELPAELAPPPATVEEPLPAEVEAVQGGIPSLVWWVAGGAAALVIAGLSYALWPSRQPPVTPTATNVAAKPVTEVAATATETNVDANPDALTAGNESNGGRSGSDVAPPAAEDSVATPASAAPPANPTIGKPTESVAPADAPSTSAAKPADTPAAVSAPSPLPAAAPAAKNSAATERPDAPSTVASTNGSNHVLKFDPLDFDPEHLSLSASPNAIADNPPSAKSAGSISADAATEAAPAADDDKMPRPADVLPRLTNQAIQMRLGPAAPADEQPADAGQRLALPVKSLQLSEVPLGRFVDAMAEMAGTAITLNPIALELNGQSPRTTVSVNVAGATLEQVLRDALGEKRLELSDSQGRLAVALAGGDERRSVDFDVDDLAGNTDAGAIAKLIEEFVAPRSWQAGGGKGTISVDRNVLHIDQTLSVRREALIFCERLRLARGRSQQTKYPAELLTLDSPYVKLSAKLQQPTTFTFLPWTRLADFVGELQELAGLTILVDWRALADVSLSPSSTVACSVNNRPWGEALDGALEPIGLAWWAVDGQTLQITSREALDRVERVEFYVIPKAQLTASAAFVDSLKKAIAERLDPADRPDDVRMQVDGPSGRLIVRASPEVHRFLLQRLETAEKP